MQYLLIERISVNMRKIKFYSGETIPLEMHKVKIVQKVRLHPIEKRYIKLIEAGNNTFQLKNEDIYLDMLTDSGVNAMSDKMQAAMLEADDSYAGSRTFTKMQTKLKELFGMDYFLPAHQGRACENILALRFIKPGNIIPMNYNFDSTKVHINRAGGKAVEMIYKEGIDPECTNPFKGNFDLVKLEKIIKEETPDNIPFVRIEAGTNLIGGQPISLENMKGISDICKKYGILLVLDASLLQDNLYFIKNREENYKNCTIRDITKEIASLMDIIYFSARKLGFARGGGMCVRDKELYKSMEEYVTIFEGFLTYGGMSVKEMEAITIGLEETMDENVISQSPEFIEYTVIKLKKYGIPVVEPGGGLGVHIDAKRFLDHLRLECYPAGALTAAIFLCSGIRCMERGTISVDRDENGIEHFADMELVRIAMPRRVYTLSQINYLIDRLKWLYDNRRLVGGLHFKEEPKSSRFYFGILEPENDWQIKLMEQYKKDFSDSL